MRPSVAIVGAGMGTLAVAATLRQAGFDARSVPPAPSYIKQDGTIR